MRISGHWLVDDRGRAVERIVTPNVGGALRPRYVVLHYTAFDDVAQAVARLTAAEAKASAHVIVARSGGMTQLAPFDRVTWHAGQSEWRGLHDLNRFSIGIELDNPGRLERDGTGYRTASGTPVHAGAVLVAEHENGGGPAAWHTYPRAQLDALRELCRALCASYGIEAILGHDRIAPRRKWDPGPAFPRAWLEHELREQLTR